MADAAAPPPDTAPQLPVSTPYLVTQPDGSTQTYVWQTNRTPSVAEVAGYAQSQGQAFAGLPEAPAQAAPAPATGPSYFEQAKTILFPQRSLASQGLSIGGAITGAAQGASLGAMVPPPLDLVTIPVGGVAGAVIGGGGGEALQYGAEKLFGWQPAESGTLAERVTSAGVRSGAGEVVGLPLRAGAQVAYRAVRPVAEAAAELAPSLAGRAWEAIPAAEQAQIAAAHPEAVAQWTSQLARGATPWSETLGPWGKMSAGGAAYNYLFGDPHAAAHLLAIPGYDLAAQTGNKLLSMGMSTPTGVQFLSALPRATPVAGPLFELGTRAVGQPYIASGWPPARTF